MTEIIEFTNNYSDMSTDTGFQFEFRCNRCGSGYRTPFQTFATGAVTNALNTASSIFGGIFGSAATVGEHVRSSQWQTAHDAAFINAAGQTKGDFVQCPRCQGWVCRKKCWNEKRGLCKDCAPDLAVEMSAAQAEKAREAILESAAISQEDEKVVKGSDWRETIRATCPSCGASLAKTTKFCPECGAKIAQAAHCTECGSKLEPGAKFCAECGHKV